MQIDCPSCSSKFNLPDKLAKPGAKLRCTVCKTVFELPGEKPASAPSAPAASKSAPAKEVRDSLSSPPPSAPERKSRKKLFWALGIILVVLACGGGGAWYYAQRPQPAEEADVAKKVEMLTMRNVRQYNVLNEKVGKVFVIEGKVVNEFPEPRELIALEGAIYDKDKKNLAVKRQLAGTQLSLFQLQVLSEKEMDSFLNNKIELLANNTNVPPGGEVPFMILFYAPPDNVAEFGVKITDVKTPGDRS